MSKPNKDGWIRHRGGKCPVEDGVAVDYRMRDGEIMTQPAVCLEWDHYGECGDIMAYRVHKPAELRYDPCADGPLQWRDRITEIDRTVEALEEERVALVQRLEGEGFRLIEWAAQPVEDMSDWRNWKAGDQVKVILANDCTGLWIDRVVTVRSIEPANYGGSMPVSVFYDGDWNFPEAHDGSDRCVFEFHSRPSK